MKHRQPTADYYADLERRAAEHVSYHDVIQPERCQPEERCTPIEVTRAWERQRDLWLAKRRRQSLVRWAVLLLGGATLAISLLVVLR